jgi:hypothetical protein
VEILSADAKGATVSDVDSPVSGTVAEDISGRDMLRWTTPVVDASVLDRAPADPPSEQMPTETSPKAGAVVAGAEKTGTERSAVSSTVGSTAA